MRLLGMLLVLAGGIIVAPAQTKAPAAAPAAAPVAAATNAPGTVRQMSLQDCVMEALRHNLDIQIDRYNPDIALFNLQGSYGGYDPTFNFSGQRDHNEAGSRLLTGGFTIPGSKSDADVFSSSFNGATPWGMTYSLQGNASDTFGKSFALATNNALLANGFESTVGSASINATQPLLKNFWIDANRLNILVAKNRLKYSEQLLRLQMMQIINQLEQAYYDLIYARENVLVQEKAVELAERLVVENRKKVEVGSLAPLDLQQAESQAATTRAALISARSTLAVQEHTVKQFITSQYSLWADIVLEPTGTLMAPRQFFNLRDSWSKGLSLRPDLKQARLDVERAGIQLKYNKNQLFPELDVFGTYGYNGSGKEFSDALYDIQQTDRPFYTAGASISVPLTRTFARNAYRSAKTVENQTVLMVKRIEENIMVAIDNDIRTAQSSYEQVAANRSAVEYAAAALDAEQKKLESGKSTTYTVLQMQRDLTNARGNEIQSLANYNKLLAQLSFDEGTTFDRLRINVNVR
jgi:outer membrane protein TolC